jgi:hypothetical protein
MAPLAISRRPRRQVAIAAVQRHVLGGAPGRERAAQDGTQSPKPSCDIARVRRHCRAVARDAADLGIEHESRRPCSERGSPAVERSSVASVADVRP